MAKLPVPRNLPCRISGLVGVRRGQGMAKKLLWIVPVVTFCLGTWQVKRLYWKRDLIDKVNEELSSPPKEISSPSVDRLLNADEFTKLLIRGVFVPDRTMLLGPRSSGPSTISESEGSGLFSTGANNGYYILTPFRIDDSDITVLVNRGWVPLGVRDEFYRTPQSYTPEHVIEIEAIVRKGERKPTGMNNPSTNDGTLFTPGPWVWLELKSMARISGCDPILLELVNPPRDDHALRPSSITPRPKHLTANIRNKHLEYVFTWYGISLITAIYLLVGSGRSRRRRL